jgi:hypothetical protein
MAARADIQVGIGGDATGLRRELDKTRGDVNGWARGVEQNVKRMGLNPFAGLLAGFSIYKLANAAGKIMDDAAAVKKLADAAKLPTAQYLILSEAAKVAGVSAQELGKMLQEYSQGERTLTSVAEAVGLIGDNALNASGKIRGMAAEIDSLAKADAAVESVQKRVGGASKLGLAATAAAASYATSGNQQSLDDLTAMMNGDKTAIRRMMMTTGPLGYVRSLVTEDLDKAIARYNAPQARPPDMVSTGFGPKDTPATRAWDSAQQGQAFENMLREDERKQQEEARKIFEKSAARQYEQDERDRIAAAAKKQDDAKRVDQIRVEAAKQMDSITVEAPRASSRLAAIGGFVGGRMGGDNASRMQAERVLKANEITADMLQKIKAILEEG